MKYRAGEAEEGLGAICGGLTSAGEHVAASVRSPRAFTLIELLVVISVISLLLGVLIPVISASRSQARQAVCSSNMRQLLLANNSYANQNNGSYVLGARDIFGENKERWYGRRSDKNSPFDLAAGPLARALSGAVINCPQKVNFMKISPSQNDYDEGSGGYGYNMTYLGSRIWEYGYEDESCRLATKNFEVRRPSETLMFADTAMARGRRLVEYSFAEPRYFVADGEPLVYSGWNPTPSIHFRHGGRANVGWVDGHVNAEEMGDYVGGNQGEAAPIDMDIGWFEPLDNSRFDLK